MPESTDGRFVHWNCPRCTRRFLHVGPADQGGVCPHCGKHIDPTEVKGSRIALQAVQEEIERAAWRAWQQATSEHRAAYEAGRAAYRAAEPGKRGPLYARSPYKGQQRWNDVPPSVRELHSWWMRGWSQAEIDVANERAVDGRQIERTVERALDERGLDERVSEAENGGETGLGAHA